MATGTSIASGTTPTWTASTTSPSQVWPRADSRGPRTPGGSSRNISKGCLLTNSCSIAWKRIRGGRYQGQRSNKSLYSGLAPLEPLGALTAWTTALARTPSELSKVRLASGGKKRPPSFFSRALWGTRQSSMREGAQEMGPRQDKLVRALAHHGQPGSCLNILKPGMALGLTLHLSPTGGDGRLGNRETMKKASGQLQHPHTHPHTPLPWAGDFCLVCLGVQSFYLRVGEQVRGSQATRSTPRPWESSTKGSRIPSRRDLWVERRTSGKPCLGTAREKCQSAPTLKMQEAETQHLRTQGSPRGREGSAEQFFL